MLLNSVPRVKAIKYVRQGTPQSHALLVLNLVHWNGQLLTWRNTADRKTWLKHFQPRTMKQYKRHDKVESCTYSDLNISVTTKVNPERHTKNKTDYGKYKLSDSWTEYYSPIEHLAFVFIVVWKAVIFKQCTTEENTQVCRKNYTWEKACFLLLLFRVCVMRIHAACAGTQQSKQWVMCTPEHTHTLKSKRATPLLPRDHPDNGNSY